MKTAAALTLLALAVTPAVRAVEPAPAKAVNDEARDVNAAARAANAQARERNGPAQRAAEARAAGGAAAAGANAANAANAAAPAKSAFCKGTIYLTFDTGSQSQAELIADTLNRHKIKATFFLANEKTVRGDYSLDPSWSAYWKARVAEGHAIGSHTFDHVVYAKDGADGKIVVKPGFGDSAGQQTSLSGKQYCEQIQRVDQRFVELTGKHLDPIWRAPAGRTSPRLLEMGQSCGYAHVGWTPAGFSGDELSSSAYPNDVLLKKSLRDLKGGDIILIHMGIWSRKDPWAPANLEPLISGLEKKDLCFATLREHPDYLSKFKR
ncbi:polysaccharide deacetylase family protein [Duganella sp. FT135W]|uniref:Polysaccharide deacetylase family protein n=1 Tax=Duganella flavida TaxID=2692175 RepID=A0A6L8K7J2_9BURK|nr:polysaccharide deacetylase family protein [Duganella flavida]MYM21874.1 polysaccharide deacetylase family protein [Duganella flavida]